MSTLAFPNPEGAAEIGGKRYDLVHLSQPGATCRCCGGETRGHCSVCGLTIETETCECRCEKPTPRWVTGMKPTGWARWHVLERHTPPRRLGRSPTQRSSRYLDSLSRYLNNPLIEGEE